MKLYYCFLLLLCPLFNRAQLLNAVALQTGDRVPEINFTEVLNATYTNTSITASPDKLTLVDFWATWCSSCIKEFPKLDSLQSLFKEQLSILLVNNPKSGDTRDKILAFLNKRKNPSGKTYSMPVIMDGDNINRLFPHHSLPHTVWIYKGKVRGITEPHQVTEANIRAVLSGDAVALEEKIEQLDFDMHTPLLQNNNGGNITATLSRSLFTHYLPGAGGAVGQSVLPGGLKRWFFINQPVLGLYSFCFPGITANRIQLNGITDSAFILHGNAENWRKENCYSYELVLPQNTSIEKVRKIMKADLDRQFGLHSRLQTVAVNCVALRQSPAYKPSITCTDHTDIKKDDQDNWVICNKPISSLIETLNWQRPGKVPYPVIIDDTGYTGTISLHTGIPNLHDIPALKNVLEQHGLTLQPSTTPLPMLVLTKSTDQ